MARRNKGKIRSVTRIAGSMALLIQRDFVAGTIPSKFAYEATFIAELRASLCLAGWPWDTADRASRDCVAEALRLARTARPTWSEGQRAYVGVEVKDSVCRQCGVGLRARQVHYCSRECRRAWNKDFNAEAA